MFNKDEIIFLWFDYNGYSFLKLEKILKNFDEISDLFDKNKVKSAIFEKGTEEIKQKLLSADFEEFESRVSDELYKNNVQAVTFISKGYPIKLKTIDEPHLCYTQKVTCHYSIRKLFQLLEQELQVTMERLCAKSLQKNFLVQGL